ncbi:hypothetical protein [Nocardia sp. NPDC051570]|uniref:hypothetical protein n=1 Tax=Nocardia sp. NPDC051570 TaxID=3364324 RepID=UPI0037B4E0F3
MDAESAFVVDDYPYSYHLLCKIRYWLETSTKGAKKGDVRMVTQTTNPRRPGESWNTPKLGQYSALRFLAQYENGHVDSVPLAVWTTAERWMRFYLSGTWALLNAYERKRVGLVVTLSERGDQVGRARWKVRMDAVRAGGCLPYEEFIALHPELEPFVEADYDLIRDYVQAGGFDLVGRWWADPADSVVDLDAEIPLADGSVPDGD